MYIHLAGADADVLRRGRRAGDGEAPQGNGRGAVGSTNPPAY